MHSSLALDLIVVRRPTELGGNIFGHRIDCSSTAVLLSEMTDDLSLSGVSLIFRDSILSYSSRFPRKSLYQAALRDRVSSEVLRLSRIYSRAQVDSVLLEAIGARHMVALHMERLDDFACEVGLVCDFDNELIRLLKVSSFGKLQKESVVRLVDVTRIEIETGYLRGIRRFVDRETFM